MNGLPKKWSPMETTIHTPLLVEAARQQGEVTGHVDSDALHVRRFTMYFVEYVVGKALDTITLRMW